MRGNKADKGPAGVNSECGLVCVCVCVSRGYKENGKGKGKHIKLTSLHFVQFEKKVIE